MGMLVFALSVNWPEFHGYLPYLTKYKLQIGSFDQVLSNELTGFYLNFSAFKASTLFYLPLALLGMWFVVRKKFWRQPSVLLFFVFFLTTFAFIAAKVVFYQRYLIILDLLIILFASITLAQLFQYFKDTKSGKWLLAIFILGFSGIILYYSSSRKPWILPAELQELKTISQQIESNAYGMSTDAYYTPWVYGYLTKRTIAPGYFINYWSYDEWKQFWYQGDHKLRQELLARYGKDPIYIFVGSGQAQNQPMRDFLDLYAARLTDHMWRYQAID